MKPGTIVRLPDGREGTVVYHGLDGYGIRWGRWEVDVQAILEGDGNTVRPCPPDYPPTLLPEAMLREPYLCASLPCVGREYTIVEAEGETWAT